VSEEEEVLRGLIEQAHLLDELTRHPGWEVLEDFCLRGPQGSAKKQTALVNGTAKTLEEYKERCGELRGIHFVLDAPKMVDQLAVAARLRSEEKLGAA
jgi:hypothetical protein